MANDHLQGTNSRADLMDAETAAKHGDARLAVFLLCRYHGGALADLWQHVEREKVTDVVPGSILVSSKLTKT